MRLLHNPALDRYSSYGKNLREILGGERFVQAQAAIQAWRGYTATPLCSLRSTAAELGVEAVLYKDESGRFGLGSFKALGGAYAVLRLLTHEVERRLGHAGIDAGDLMAGKYRDCTRQITVTCATDGNHGRSVAWGAQMFGCRCVIFLHETVSEGRADAIAVYGAEVRRSPGNYDDAVRMAARTAAAENWFVVSDTSYEGYLDVPRDVMQGYAVMVEEALQQLPAARMPTHIFIQGGVGGLAAAVCGHLWERLGTRRPRLVVVEPENAACLYASAEAGKPTAVHGSLETVMAGLSCGEPSLIAWQILATGADDFMTIPDEPALESMRRLAAGASEDPPIVAGESAVAGLAALLLVAGRPDDRRRLGLGPQSRVLLFGTEGATDPQLYRQIVGRDAAEVEGAAAARPTWSA
jgi:diaminopropionate ammonia-lyase